MKASAMNRAEKLLNRMRANRSGWGQRDFAVLYKGFGFDAIQGANHTIYIHPQYTELRATVGRHNSLATGYADHAIKTIEQLKVLQSSETKEDER